MNAPVDVTNIRIETDRLILCAWRETDLADFYEYASVEGVGEMAGWNHHQSTEESRRILDFFISGKKTFALELKENGKVIGSLGLEPRDEDAGLPEELQGREIGYVLSRDYWGRGLMPEAVKAVIDYCFQELSFDYLTCGHFDRNDRSRRVVEKSGFRFLKDVVTPTARGVDEPVQPDETYRQGETAMFELKKTEGKARRGEFTCAHGTVQTPVFMNVGTQGAIKGALSAKDLKDIGCQVELSNTYHLHLRPTDTVVRQMGGLHKFMTWDGPILTDSGGFQVFSLASLRKIKEEGVYFASHIDGHKIFMGPEESMQIQSNLGSDMCMAFDECIENPSPRDYVQKSVDRTYRWLVRCKAENARLNALPDTVNPQQMLWGINQGGTYTDIRVDHMKRIAELDLPGYAIGGLAVGETTQEMYDIIEAVEEHMPVDKTRYLMGVGTPSNIIEAVARGVDFFDCVMPARNARHARLFTWEGAINLKNAKYITDDSPIDPHCDCPVCRRYSRAYIRHLFVAEEMLAMRLSVMHNLYFYNKLMEKIRQSLDEGRFEDFRREYSEKLGRRI